MSKAYCSGGNWSKRVLFHYRDNDEDECMSYITTKSICEKLSEIA